MSLINSLSKDMSLISQKLVILLTCVSGIPPCTNEAFTLLEHKASILSEDFKYSIPEKSLSVQFFLF